MSRIVCSGLLVAALGALLAQQPASSVATNVLEEIPALSGVYYRAPTEWVALPSATLMPYASSTWKWWWFDGKREYAAQIGGEHATTRTGGQPVFVVRGLATRVLPVMIRFHTVREARSISMPLQQQIHDYRTPFPKESRVELDSYVVGHNSVAIRPKAPLPPGEYAVVASPNPNSTRLFYTYDFSVAN